MGWVQRQRYGLDHMGMDMGCVHPWVGYRDNGMGWTTRRWTWVASIHGLGSETTVWVGPHGDGHELGLSMGWVQRPRYGLDHMGMDMGWVHLVGKILRNAAIL